METINKAMCALGRFITERKPKAIIGLDPGVNTGFALSINGKLQEVTTLTHNAARKRIEAFKTDYDLLVIFEDANKRGCNPKMAAARAQGAGSVKRDCNLWREYFIEEGIQFKAVPPQKGLTKVDKVQFKYMTGWQGRVSNHARDAAMLIWGMR